MYFIVNELPSSNVVEVRLHPDTKKAIVTASVNSTAVVVGGLIFYRIFSRGA